MLPDPIRRMLPALSLTVAAAAQAGHEAPAAGRASPLDATADVPAVTYDSAFARYRPHADQALRPWKDANDNVGRIGGWRSYAREAAQEEPAPKAPDGHHKH
ncbi:hypothetical protein [uncultured Methylibium sp.]|uniref:hypothetical protein n=1 Tax=uncultured Methylibium sp. TaxID=381093 RepID=UPI0025D57510|nr:hypothetical protein [uncultured Methylibium sp.]